MTDTGGIKHRPRPVVRFLGDQEATGGPFALLGLSPAACTDELVLAALDRQIERINHHAECDTPEADEVRLALHAAAAQLLDPIVRRHLIAKWTGTAVAPAQRAKQPRPSVPAAPHRVAPAPALATKLLEADAILTLGLFGGWNQRSLRRLLTLAHARGLTNAQVAQTLTGLARRRRAPRRAAPRPVQPVRRARSRAEFETLERSPAAVASPAATVVLPPSGLPSSDEVDPAQHLLRNAVIFGGIGLLGLAAAFTLILVLTSGPIVKSPPPAPAPPGPVAASGEAPSPEAPAPTATPKQPARVPVAPGDLAGVKREFAACAESVQTDPSQAAQRFEGAVATLSAHWPKVPRDQLVACNDAILEYLYKAPADMGQKALAAIGAGLDVLAAPEPPAEDRILPAVWSAGVLVRLSHERDIPAAAKAFIESRLNLGLGQARPALEQTFEAGIAAALGVMPARLTPPATSGPAGVCDLESWRRWGEGVGAVGERDAGAAQRLLLAGLETLLVSGPEPNVNRSMADAISELCTRISWRNGPQDEGRRWLLRWFSDARVSAADLHAVTSVLATRSSAEGVDLTMVLSTAASEKARADLRDRYATVWSLSESVSRDDLTAAWIKAAKEAINKSYSGADDAEDLASAVVLARLNEAATWQWRGDAGEAAQIVGDLRAPVDAALTPTNAAPASPDLALSEGAWAEKYLAARQNIKVRRDMIEQLVAGTQGALGPVDAEVLVGEAFTGSPQEMRTVALDAVKRFSDNPSVIAAVVERLPRLQRTPANTSIIEFLTQRQLPPSKDPDWPIVARRVLVERLLEAIAAESPMARVDRLSTLLAVSYRSMAAASPLPADQRAVKTQPPAHASAAQVWQRWRSMAESVVPTAPPPTPLDQIDRRRAGRLSQAQGMIQRFAAEQASVCEVMAYVIHAEQPDRSEQIKLILSQFADERRHATSILHQLSAAERAIVQLWLVRFKEDPAS